MSSMSLPLCTTVLSEIVVTVQGRMIINHSPLLLCYTTKQSPLIDYEAYECYNGPWKRLFWVFSLYLTRW
jgi:hypothetical protein